MSHETSAIKDTFQNTSDSVVADLKRIIGDADDLLNKLTTTTADELTGAQQNIEATLRDARARIRNARHLLARRAGRAAAVSSDYIHENPWKAVGVASVLGLVAALLLGRRVLR